jgi:predicted CXXCH cytochrome family protein
MKRLTFSLAVAALSVLVAAAAGAQISNTAHDMSARGWNTSGEICVVCHTPHNADATYEPLWNHAVTAEVFSVYSSNTLDAAVGQPDGTSKLCLSCHDGSLGVDDFGGSGTSAEVIAGAALMGTDLSNDHPISFTYVIDSGLYDPAVQNSGLGGTIDEDLLFGGKVECGSCHDVHDNSNPPFLRMSNAGSDLCLTCHNK